MRAPSTPVSSCLLGRLAHRHVPGRQDIAEYGKRSFAAFGLSQSLPVSASLTLDATLDGNRSLGGGVSTTMMTRTIRSRRADIFRRTGRCLKISRRRAGNRGVRTHGQRRGAANTAMENSPAGQA